MCSTDYDAIIIGAGIGGLVCGCYLAKAGMRVLILEQHHKPGGYCTSFMRHGFTFDAAAHSFGGFRPDGITRKVCSDFGLEQRINIQRFDPSDIIVTPNETISFRSDMNRTIECLRQSFPHEAENIRTFFSFIIGKDSSSSVHMRKWSFQDLLDAYFRDSRLKAILSFPLWGNAGLPPSSISAFIGIKVYTEFHIDGGYYPGSCMQAFSDVFAARFMEFGGEIRLSCRAGKIMTRSGEAAGVVIKNGDFIPAKYVISNCDATQTFVKLFGRKTIGDALLSKLKNMVSSLSTFVVYIGLDESLVNLPNPGSNIWYLPHYDIQKMYNAAQRRNLNNVNEFMMRVSPSSRAISAYFHSSFKNKAYWARNKDKFLELMIEKIQSTFIPDLSKHIKYRDAATPYTLYRYTLNHRGASYGWASTPNQFADIDFKKPPFVKNFYMTGHWTTQGLGIPGVMYSGWDIARLILKRDRYPSGSP